MTISLDTTIDELRTQGIVSVRTYNVCRNANINNLHQLLQFDTTDLLKVRNCGRKTFSEIIDVKTKFKDILAKNLIPENEHTEPSENRPVDIARKKVSNLHPSAKYQLNNWLEWRYEKLSVRAKNRIPNYVTLDVVLPIAFSDTEFDFRNIKNCGKKSGAEIKSYIADVRAHIEDLISNVELGEPKQALDKEELVKSQIENEHPYLLDKEVLEVASFYIQHGHLPWLYMIHKYILRTDNVKVQIHRDFYGLNPEGVNLTLEEIGIKHNLSRERIRQIAHSKLPLPGLLVEYVSSELQHLLSNIVSCEDSVCTNIIQENMLEHSENILFGLLCSVTGKYITLQLGNDCNKFLVKRVLLDNVRPKAALHEICRLLELRRTAIEKIDILSAIKEDRKRIYNPHVADLTAIFVDYVKRHYDYSISKNRYIIALPNALNIGSAIENILEQRGSAMSLSELWSEFKILYPNSNVNTIESFKQHIIRSQSVKSKGKTGMYVLKHWKNHFTGSITDYLETILDTLNEPITLDDLVEFAQEQFPSTTKKSIYTLVCIDRKKRFAIFEDDFIGLVKHINTSAGLKEKRQTRRYSFDSRFETLKLFISQHKRLPLKSGNYSDEEQSLARWVANVLNGNIDVPPCQIQRLKDFLTIHNRIPQNGAEYRFKQMCDIIKVYVNNHFALPTLSNNPSEYNWLHKNLVSYSHYSDNRKHYFLDLLSFLKDYGFYFE